MLCKSVCDLALLLFIPYVVCAPEPICSKFSFEEQLLEKMVRTEFKVDTVEKEIKRTQENVLQVLKEKSIKTLNLINDFENLKNNISKEMEKTTSELKENSIKTTTNLINDFENLKNNISKEMEKTTSELKENSIKTTTNLINDFENLKNNIAKEMEKKTSELQLIEGRMEYPAIAFHAHHVTKTGIATGQTIVFDRFILNEGSEYDTSTGIFTSPEGGLYQFNVHVCSGSNNAHFSIVLEGNDLSKTSQYSQVYCDSISAVARVKTGERVWVKATSTSTLLEDMYRQNTFSGALIHK